jgi:hypothetical protein
MIHVEREGLRRTGRVVLAGLALALMIGAAPAAAENECGPITESLVMTASRLACWDGAIVGDGIDVDLAGLTVHGQGLLVVGTGNTVRNGHLEGQHDPDDWEAAGIEARPSSGTKLGALTIEGFNIGVYAGDRTSVENSTVVRNERGIYNFIESSGLRATNVRFEDNGVGILFNAGTGARMVGNRFVRNDVGILAGPSDLGGMGGSVVRENRFEENGFGVRISQFVGANGVTIEKNRFMRSRSSGIAIVSFVDMESDGGGRDAVIRDNIVLHSGTDPETVTTCFAGTSAVNCVTKTADDGITIIAQSGSVPPTMTVGGNRTVRNAGHGIYAPGVTDGGRNVAAANGQRPACIGVACRGSR